MKSLLSCMALAMAAVASCQLSKNEIVLGGDFAYGLLPAEPVCKGMAFDMRWSSSGEYLLVQRGEMSTRSLIDAVLKKRQSLEDIGEISITFFSMTNHTATVAWHSKPSVAMVESVNWITGTDRAVMIVSEPLRTVDPTQPRPSRQTAFVIDARTGSTSSLFTIQQQDGIPRLTFNPSPTRPYGILAIESTARQAVAPFPDSGPQLPNWSFEFRQLRADGSVSEPLSIEKSRYLQSWSADGANPLLISLSVEGGKRKVQQSIYDLATGKASEVPMTRGYEEKPTKLALKVETRSSKIGVDPASRSVYNAWLQGTDETQALIAGDVNGMDVTTLSPTLNAVAYVSQGVPMVRPILQMPKSAYLEALAAAEKTEAISNAKQAALAALMYATDWDDKLPGKGENIHDLLMPYSRNSSILDSFIYTFGGGLMSGIQNPATTELGYVLGPGGRAVAYVDGHVRWVPDK